MANLKFYMTPGSCSTGIHIILEELELIFEAYVINLLKGEQYKAEYLAINPKASVPALDLGDGTVLTDFVSIALWLAENHKPRGLLPISMNERIDTMEVLEYVVKMMHGQGFSRIFTPEKFVNDLAGIENVQKIGRAIVQNGFAFLNDKLNSPTFRDGKFSIADAALFYVEFWADRTGIELPTRCMKHFSNMLTRPSVRQVLMEEGYYSVVNRTQLVSPNSLHGSV